MSEAYLLGLLKAKGSDRDRLDMYLNEVIEQALRDVQEELGIV